MVDEQTPDQARFITPRFAIEKMQRRFAQRADAQKDQNVMKLNHWRNPTKAVRESHISFFNTTPLVFAAQIQGRKGGTVKSKTITCHVLAKPHRLEQ
jgi:hypothetical protein